MAKLDLSVVDIRSLIDTYTSDLRQLQFKSASIKANIEALEEMLGKGTPAPAKEEKKESKAGRPPKKQKQILEAPVDVKEVKETKPEKATKTPKVEKTAKKGPGRPRLIPLDQIKVEKPKKEKPVKATKAEKPAKVSKKAPAEGAVKRGRIPGFNRWEEGIIDMLRSSNRPLKNEELMEAMTMIAKRDNVQEGPAQLKVRLNQALVKLGNKLGMLKKSPSGGKGFLYSLK